MRRRDVLSLLGGAAVSWPVSAKAQQNHLARVGVLIDVSETHPAAKRWVELFETQLGLTGWQKGRNVEITYRWGSSNPEHLARYAEELMQSAPDIFMVHGTPALIPLRKLTNTIPIVFTAVSDPISQGFVASVSHPGGNLTGFSNFDTDIGSKWLQVLKDIAPSLKEVSVMFNPRTSPYNSFFMNSVGLPGPLCARGFRAGRQRPTSACELPRAARGHAQSTTTAWAKTHMTQQRSTAFQQLTDFINVSACCSGD